MKINFGIIAVADLDKPLDVLHFVGYENKPTAKDFADLRKEIEIDPAFGLTGRMENIMLSEAPQDIISRYAIILSKIDWTQLKPLTQKHDHLPKLQQL